MQYIFGLLSSLLSFLILIKPLLNMAK